MKRRSEVSAMERRKGCDSSVKSQPKSDSEPDSLASTMELRESSPQILVDLPPRVKKSKWIVGWEGDMHDPQHREMLKAIDYEEDFDAAEAYYRRKLAQEDAEFEKKLEEFSPALRAKMREDYLLGDLSRFSPSQRAFFVYFRRELLEGKTRDEASKKLPPPEPSLSPNTLEEQSRERAVRVCREHLKKLQSRTVNAPSRAEAPTVAPPEQPEQREDNDSLLTDSFLASTQRAVEEHYARERLEELHEDVPTTSTSNLSDAAVTPSVRVSPQFDSRSESGSHSESGSRRLEPTGRAFPLIATSNRRTSHTRSMTMTSTPLRPSPRKVPKVNVRTPPKQPVVEVVGARPVVGERRRIFPADQATKVDAEKLARRCSEVLASEVPALASRAATAGCVEQMTRGTEQPYASTIDFSLSDEALERIVRESTQQFADCDGGL